jgi:hypothetical protein
MRKKDPQSVARANALFAKKRKWQTEGVAAVSEYRQQQQKQLDNLARLRAQRLATGFDADKKLP